MFFGLQSDLFLVSFKLFVMYVSPSLDRNLEGYSNVEMKSV